MPKAKDITGQKFGKLTAIKRIDRKGADGSYFWLFECECGNKKEMMICNVIQGKSISCGCVTNENNTKRSHKIMLNKRFGRLVIVSDTGKRQGQQVIWQCACDCGNLCEAISANLLNGSTCSCGCLQRETILINSKNLLLPENQKKSKEANGEMLNTRATSLTMKLSKRNTSGIKGVSITPNNTWNAKIKFKGKQYHLGNYKLKEDAAKIRKQAEEMLFEPFLEWYNENFKKEEKQAVVK